MRFEIENIKECKQLLDSLPDKLQKNVLMRIFKRHASRLVDDERRRLLAHGNQYNKLADAIGIMGVKSPHPVMIVGIRAKGKYKYSGYIGHWVEYGTSGVKQKKSVGKDFKVEYLDEKDQKFLWVSRVGRGERYRMDQKPRPFMRPAVDSMEKEIVNGVVEDLSSHLFEETQKAVNRYNKAKARKSA